MVQAKSRPTDTVYQKWIKEEGLPIHESLGGMDDVTELDRKPWARTGGSGCFIEMLGTIQAQRGTYVAEIPGGGALNPERHMYEEAIFVIEGRGLTEVWHEGGAKVSFEWGTGSVFSLPLNTWHRLVNGAREPAVVLGVTTAPMTMNMVHNTEFVFNCDYQFTDRFGGESDYFSRGENRERRGSTTIWETNFIPDSSAEFLDPHERKVAGGELIGYRMGTYFPNGHISQWPMGRYHKAHYHEAGAMLLGLKGKGYVLLWPKELGLHPYQDGHEDQVVSVNWGPRSIYTPPNDWFHQHFSTGKEPARHVAIYEGLDRPEDRFHRVGEDLSVVSSVRDGGALIEYEDEDPAVRRNFVEALTKEGIECTMPPVTYRQ